MENLTEENFLVLCAKNYKNTQCYSTEEFLDDIKRFKYLKKIFTRYSKTNIIDERLVLNHIIILNNVFYSKFLCRIFFLKMPDQIKYIKPFLLYLNILPEDVENVNGINYNTIDIPMDEKIIKKLREFNKKI
jgi:hypothetical protein